MSDDSAAIARAQIDTSRVANRRELRFESLNDMMDDVERLLAADEHGNLRQLGNWTLGQMLGHLGWWINFSYGESVRTACKRCRVFLPHWMDLSYYAGAPRAVPSFIRWMLWLGKRRCIYGKMRSGVLLPGVEGGTFGSEELPVDEGLAWLIGSVQRLRCKGPSKPNVIFGPLTHEEWIALNLRHAELHLSFLIPEDASERRHHGHGRSGGGRKGTGVNNHE